MRVLVIGGTGFMGPHVVRSLAGMGHEVTVFHRGRTEAELPAAVRHLHVEPGEAGRREFGSFAAEFRQIAPEVVLDMIPMTEADARATVEAFRGIAGRLVAISSGDVYRAYDRMRGKDPGPPDQVPLTEDAPLRERLYPYQDYAVPPHLKGSEDHFHRYEKILVERVAMSDPELVGTVLRLPAVYGPADRQYRLFAHLKRMDDGRPAILMSEEQARWRWSRGYVENVAAAITLAVTEKRAAGRIYNVAEPDPLTEAEWVLAIGRAIGWNGQVVPVPATSLPAHLKADADWRQDMVVDTTRIRTELSYEEVVTREEGLRRAVEWERANPPEWADSVASGYEAEDAVLAEVGR